MVPSLQRWLSSMKILKEKLRAAVLRENLSSHPIKPSPMQHVVNMGELSPEPSLAGNMEGKPRGMLFTFQFGL